MKDASEAGFGTSHEEELQRENELLRQQNAELQAKLHWFEEQLRLQRQRTFGKSSEQVSEQVNLFNEAESEAKPELPEPTVEEVVRKRQKPDVTRESMREDLPFEVVEYTIPEEKQVCDCCGGKLHDMGTDEHREIKYIPARTIILKHVRHRYACRACDREGTESKIVSAPVPASVLPKSMATPSLIAAIIENKFMQGEPLYRQEQQFERLGIHLSRQIMSNWLLTTAERWFQPIYQRMRQYLCQRDILHADETTLQVLEERGGTSDKESYMWLYRTGRDGAPIVLYDYQTTRAGKHPKAFLSHFKGYLQTDGYGGYNDMPGIISVGCWAHARRKFHDALKVLPREEALNSAAQKGFDFCNRLYRAENIWENGSPQKRQEGRHEISKAILDEFHAWLKWNKARMLPKSTFATAVTYCLNQWEPLTAFLRDGRLELDNNRAERSIKPFVIGRKNWLFSNTAKGARGSATIYSMVETAKENRLNAPKYLEWLLTMLPNMNINDSEQIDSLLPWSEAVPADCRM